MALNLGALPNNAVLIGPFIIDDLAAGGSGFLPCPVDGRVTWVGTAINGALTTANEAVTWEVNGTAIAGSAVTIAYTSSAAGDVDQADVNDVPTAYVKRGDSLEMISAGDSSSAAARRLTGYMVVLQ